MVYDVKDGHAIVITVVHEDDARKVVELLKSIEVFQGPSAHYRVEAVDRESGPAAGSEEAVWEMTVKELSATIEAEEDANVVRALLATEKRNPSYTPDGRSGVVDAAEERLGEIGTQSDG